MEDDRSRHSSHPFSKQGERIDSTLSPALGKMNQIRSEPHDDKFQSQLLPNCDGKYFAVLHISTSQLVRIVFSFSTLEEMEDPLDDRFSLPGLRRKCQLFVQIPFTSDVLHRDAGSGILFKAILTIRFPGDDRIYLFFQCLQSF